MPPPKPTRSSQWIEALNKYVFQDKKIIKEIISYLYILYDLKLVKQNADPRLKISLIDISSTTDNIALHLYNFIVKTCDAKDIQHFFRDNEFRSFLKSIITNILTSYTEQQDFKENVLNKLKGAFASKSEENARYFIAHFNKALLDKTKARDFPLNNDIKNFMQAYAQVAWDHTRELAISENSFNKGVPTVVAIMFGFLSTFGSAVMLKTFYGFAIPSNLMYLISFIAVISIVAVVGHGILQTAKASKASKHIAKTFEGLECLENLLIVTRYDEKQKTYSATIEYRHPQSETTLRGDTGYKHLQQLGIDPASLQHHADNDSTHDEVEDKKEKLIPPPNWISVKIGNSKLAYLRRRDEMNKYKIFVNTKLSQSQQSQVLADLEPQLSELAFSTVGKNKQHENLPGILFHNGRFYRYKARVTCSFLNGPRYHARELEPTDPLTPREKEFIDKYHPHVATSPIFTTHSP